MPRNPRVLITLIKYGYFYFLCSRVARANYERYIITVNSVFAYRVALTETFNIIAPQVHRCVHKINLSFRKMKYLLMIIFTNLVTLRMYKITRRPVFVEKVKLAFFSILLTLFSLGKINYNRMYLITL